MKARISAEAKAKMKKEKVEITKQLALLKTLIKDNHISILNRSYRIIKISDTIIQVQGKRGATYNIQVCPKMRIMGRENLTIFHLWRISGRSVRGQYFTVDDGQTLELIR